MPRLTGILRRLGGDRRDRGGVATIVAVTLAGGVLLGMAAFVVDVGTLYTEREELISGADAAAQRLALDCSRTGGLCGDQDFTRAAEAANGNAKDSLSSVDMICGYESGGRLKSCPAAPAGAFTNCLNSAPTGGVNWVEVRTSTLVSGDKTVLPSSFAQSVVPGYTGATVRACSRVAFGPPAGGVAVTMSSCEWDKYTSDGTDFAPLPPYPPNPAARYEHAVLLHDPSSKDNGCGAGPAGKDAPGGFGWTDPTSLCHTVIVGGTYTGNTGNSAPKDCPAELAKYRADRSVIMIPIYDEVTSSGNNTTYTGGNAAGFVITGYRIPSVDVPSWLTGESCPGGNGGGNTGGGNNGGGNNGGGNSGGGNNSTTCILGFFVGGLQTSTGDMPGTGPSYGVTVLKTIG